MMLRHRIQVALVTLGTYACASPGVPPGGPKDVDAPQIIGTAPDSGRTGILPRNVVFRFDEVVSERPAGSPTLEALFMISPRDGAPSVDWNRDEVAVRPRRGWRRNITYTVSPLPGVTDLRGNVRNTGKTLVFATGPTLATGRISGRVFNWIAGTPSPRALVEARAVSDTSLVFVTLADSSGAYLFHNVAPATYRLRGIIDENKNGGLDVREPWDTATVVLADSTGRELLAFLHDSIPARIANVVLRDSVTLEVLLDSPVDPTQQLSAANVTVTASDSTRIPTVSVMRPPGDTSGAQGVRPSRPPPARSILVKLGRPITVAGDLRVRAIDLRGLTSAPATSERVARLAPIPKAAVPPGAPVLPPPPPPIKR
jgi:hypothetical protein